MDSLMALFSDFDIAAFLPKMDTLVGWIELALRLAVMAGPLLLLGFGLLFLLAPPKEANHALGFRCWWGMASLEAWQYTQRMAGLIWGSLGALLTVIMALICNAFRRMPPPKMVDSAVACLIWVLALTVASCLAINILVIVRFDKNGFRRVKKAKEEEG